MGPEWIERAVAGDEEAFAKLIDQFKGYLMATILPIVRDPGEAQDVLQEAFWQIYRSLPNYRGGNLKFWLARIATRKAIDWCRQRERRSRELLHDSPGDMDSSAALSAEEEYLSQAAAGRLASLLKALPPPYRVTMTGYFLEGKSYRQLADEAGVSEKTVESRLYRARRFLKSKCKEGL